MQQTKYKQTEIGEIPEDWEVTTLGGTATLNYGKSLPEMSRSTGGVPVYGSSGVTGCHSQALVQDEGYIIGRKGTIGTVHYSPEPFYPIDTTYYVTKDDINCDFKYFYYLLKYLNLDKLNFDSAVPGLNRNVAYRQKYAIPKSISEQQQIASILSSLDDKIELNRKMNKTLEEIGKALFKRWFVDFEFPFDSFDRAQDKFAQGKPDSNGKPYKSSGGEMVYSELGEIPEGWRVGRLKDLIKITSGKRPKVKVDDKTEDYSVPIVGASGIMGYTSDILYDEKIIVTGRVGTLGVVQKIEYPCWMSDNALVIQSEYHEYVYGILSAIDYSTLNVGSTQPLVTQSAIKDLDIVIPRKLLLQKFELIVGSLTQKIKSNNEETEMLKGVRDSLLPRLISGKLRVKN